MTRVLAQRPQATAAFGWSRRLVRVALMLVLSVLPGAIASAQAPQSTAVKGAAALAVSNGFARILIKLDDDVDVEASVAGNVLVVRFKRPVEIDVGKLADGGP